MKFSNVLYLLWTHTAFVDESQNWKSVYLNQRTINVQERICDAVVICPRLYCCAVYGTYVFSCVLISSLSLRSFSSPLNEDVFTLPRALEESTLTPDIAQLSEQIHRLLVQPVHSSSSQGYGSLASNGSHELQPSAASSSESNGTTLEDPAQLHKPVSTHMHTILNTICANYFFFIIWFSPRLVYL